jgi:electron transport complex protein RnfD
VISAIVVAKQLYGGLGSNPFNPAMVGYALVLVSFPVAMTTNWADPAMLWDGAPGFGETLATIASGQQTAVDGWTMATPLDEYKHKITTHTAVEVLNHPTFGEGIAKGWEWVNGAFLAGGLLLIGLRIISWHIPAGFLGGLIVMSLAFGNNADLYTASAGRRNHAGCVLYCHRSGFSRYQPPGKTDLRGRDWHPDLPDSYLGQLSGRRGVQRSANEFCRTVH